MVTETPVPARLTPQRAALLDATERFWREHGYGPTVRELAGVMGHASVSTTHTHLLKLRDQGRVTWEDGLTRTLRLTPEGTKCLVETR